MSPGAAIAVTGAGGFVGRALTKRLSSEGYAVRAILRSDIGASQGVETFVIDDLATAGPEIFEGCSAVVNLAARVHVTNERSTDPEREYSKYNTDMAIRLARAARTAGVARFVQMSSVAAVQSLTPDGIVADDSYPASPQSAYGRSKLAADLALAEISSGAMTIAALRPPTVFGPGVSAYFQMLMTAARMRLPLPLAKIDNRRSFMFVENLASATLASIQSEREGAYIVTDSAPLSTADLYRLLLRSLGHSDRLPAMPGKLVRGLARMLLGKRADSLLGSAAFESERFRRVFDWVPEVPFREAVEKTVESSRC